MTINIFVLKGDLNAKIVVVRFFFCRVYMHFVCFDSLRPSQQNFSHVGTCLNILSINEKLPASKFQYFGKYIKQLFGYCFIHVSGHRQTGLKGQFNEPWNYGAREAHAFYVFLQF